VLDGSCARPVTCWPHRELPIGAQLRHWRVEVLNISLNELARRAKVYEIGKAHLSRIERDLVDHDRHLALTWRSLARVYQAEIAQDDIGHYLTGKHLPTRNQGGKQ
jgi:hypothetical protein